MTASLPYTAARIDADIAGAERRLVEARAFRTEVDALRGTATSRDRAVSVTVDASGLVVDLALADPLPPARELQQLVLALVREAQQDVAQRATATAKDRFGASSPVVARVDEEFKTRFDAPPADGAAKSGLGPGGRWLQ